MNYGIGNVKSVDKSKALFTTTTAPTESGGVITLATTDIVESGFKAGDYLAYVDSNNISALYSISAISSGTATLSLIGNMGGGGKQLYRHSFVLRQSTGDDKLGVYFESEDNTPITTANLTTFAKWLYDNGYIAYNKVYTAITGFIYYDNAPRFSYGIFSENGSTLKATFQTSGASTSSIILSELFTGSQDVVSPI